jgi:hypothetical protein
MVFFFLFSWFGRILIVTFQDFKLLVPVLETLVWNLPIFFKVDIQFVWISFAVSFLRLVVIIDIISCLDEAIGNRLAIALITIIGPDPAVGCSEWVEEIVME